jgi:hypothetical protein
VPQCVPPILDRLAASNEADRIGDHGSVNVLALCSGFLTNDAIDAWLHPVRWPIHARRPNRTNLINASSEPKFGFHRFDQCKSAPCFYAWRPNCTDLTPSLPP